MQVLGIDVGGSGIKGAIVDTEKGELVGERLRLDTPQPSRPHAVAEVIATLVQQLNYAGWMGCTFPAIIKHGVAYSAANVDPLWIGTNAQELFQTITACPSVVVNDADAAGLAEMRFGAGKDVSGVVFMLTFGTGIGSAIFVNGHLLPNSELGHMEIRGKAAELRASDRVREVNEMGWAKWARRVNEYLQKLEFLFSPDLFIIGGGVSKRHEQFFPYLEVKTPIVPAKLRNDAGIVGAAVLAAEQAGQ